MDIHETAVVDPNAKLGNGVVIGPYSVITGDVTLHDNVEIANHVSISGKTTIGEGTRVFSGSVVGSDPQDKKFIRGSDVALSIGKHNVIREYVTINIGTPNGGGITTIGDDNFLMAYSHVAHDCHIGSHCVMANGGTLGGHVTIDDHAVVGGLSAIHQFTRVGRLSIIGGCSKVVQDIPPYSMCDGHPVRVYNVNSIGLKRNNISLSSVKALKQAIKILFHSGLSRDHAVEEVQKNVEQTEEVKHLLDFMTAESKRGITS